MLSISDNVEDGLLNLVIPDVCALIEESCGRTFAQAVYTEFYSPDNTPAIILRQRPVTLIPLLGNTTSGSPTVTGLASTAGLVVGMPAVGAGIPAGATISAIGSGQ